MLQYLKRKFTIQLKIGILESTDSKSFVEMDSEKMLLGERYLKDTIQKLILYSLEKDERRNFKEENSFNLFISFNDSGFINKISIGYGEAKSPVTIMEKVILKKAKEVLAAFPQLMKVKHERYKPPNVNIFFNGHCLLFPEDREYGCDYG